MIDAVNPKELLAINIDKIIFRISWMSRLPLDPDKREIKSYFDFHAFNFIKNIYFQNPYIISRDAKDVRNSEWVKINIGELFEDLQNQRANFDSQKNDKMPLNEASAGGMMGKMKDYYDPKFGRVPNLRTNVGNDNFNQNFPLMSFNDQEILVDGNFRDISIMASILRYYTSTHPMLLGSNSRSETSIEHSLQSIVPQITIIRIFYSAKLAPSVCQKVNLVESKINDLPYPSLDKFDRGNEILSGIYVTIDKANCWIKVMVSEHSTKRQLLMNMNSCYSFGSNIISHILNAS